jgi:phage replication-related protein YjqB (UPF0714/DUF867 family)
MVFDSRACFTRSLSNHPHRPSRHYGGATIGGRGLLCQLTGADQALAEWIAEQLEAAGYTTLLQAWDLRPGSDFLHQMQQATNSAQRTVAVLPSEKISGLG